MNWAKKIANYMTKYSPLSSSGYQIFQFFIAVFGSEILKDGLLLIVAWKFNIVLPMLSFIIPYGILRYWSGGIHMGHWYTCLIYGLLIYFGGTYLSIYISLSRLACLLLYFVLLIPYHLYSPTDSGDIEPGPNTQRKHKIWTVISLTGIFAFAILFGQIPNLVDGSIYRSAFTFAAIAQCINLLPLTRRFVKPTVQKIKPTSNQRFSLQSKLPFKIIGQLNHIQRTLNRLTPYLFMFAVIIALNPTIIPYTVRPLWAWIPKECPGAIKDALKK